MVRVIAAAIPVRTQMAGALMVMVLGMSGLHTVHANTGRGGFACTGELTGVTLGHVSVLPGAVCSRSRPPSNVDAQKPLSSTFRRSTAVRGTWRVTYGAPAVVTISASGGRYTMVAKTRIKVSNSSCFLRPGTILAHFAGSGRSYSGQHGLWYMNCSFARWTAITLTLNSNATKLTAIFLRDNSTLVFTRL